MESNILLKKEYPENYPIEIQEILDKITLSNDISILGSMSIRSMLYASDYDIMNVVKGSIPNIERKIKQMIKKVHSDKNIFIGDIKLGEKKEWRIIDNDAYINERGRYVGYNPSESKKKLDILYKNGVISKEELREGKNALIAKPTKEQLFKINKMLRFNILRWRPADLLKGSLTLRNGEKYLLKDALKDDAIFKIDFIVLLENGIFQEFNIIYDVRDKEGIRVSTPSINTIETLKRDIELYGIVGNWFKVAKRKFSLYNYQFKFMKSKRTGKLVDKIEKLFKLLNSDLGIVYNVIQDIQVLKYLIENQADVKLKDIQYEVDGFIDRLANVYSINSYLKQEPEIIKQLHLILSSRRENQIMATLEKIEERLNRILNNETQKKLKGL